MKEILVVANLALVFGGNWLQSMKTLEKEKNNKRGLTYHKATPRFQEDVRKYSKLYKQYDAEYCRQGINPKLPHYASRIRAAYEIGGVSMIFRRLFID